MPLMIALPRRSLVFMTISVGIVMLAGVAYAYLPSATVVITPSVETKTATQTIIISEAVKDPDFVLYKLPAKTIRSEAAEERTFTRGGGATFDDFARGRVTLFNSQESTQELLPQTNLVHEPTGTFFLTDTGVAIPPGGEIGITVTAKEKGSSGNVKPGKFIIAKLPAYLQQKVYGESGQEFSGGLAVSTPISEEEVKQAKEQVMQTLQEQLRSDLTTQVGGAPLSPDFIDFSEKESSVSVPVGSKASQFKVTVKALGRAFILDENDLLALTLLKLRAQSSPEQEFLEYDPKTFSMTMIKRDFDHGEAIVESSLTGSFATKIGPKAFSGQNLAGLSTQEVKEELLKFPGVADVEVKLSPFWVNAIPPNPNSINVVVKKEQD